MEIVINQVLSLSPPPFFFITYEKYWKGMRIVREKQMITIPNTKMFIYSMNLRCSCIQEVTCFRNVFKDRTRIMTRCTCMPADYSNVNTLVV